MGLLNKLTADGSNLSQFDGNTPSQMAGANPLSTLHREYSLNGAPTMVSKPSPSILDLDGITPSKYLDNLPG
jgi:hypothetical protein